MKNKKIIYSVFGLQEKKFMSCKTRQEARDLYKNNKNYKILDLAFNGTLTLKGVIKSNKSKTGNRYYIAY